MRVDALTVALRPRSAWEATDLGIALVRRHAARIYAAWMLVTLPVVAVASALGWLVDLAWLGGVLVWWLKPAFDRIPLYVLSRAVFGEAPGVRETVRAQLRWGWASMRAWLTWRRLHPGRGLLLPVDLLEALRGAARRDRVRVLARAQGSNNVILLIACLHLELMLFFAIIALALMFVPVDFFSDSARAIYETLVEEAPPSSQVLMNFVAWGAMTLIEPFFVGAGFGLYLNRRTHLEAWDVELAFRRIAARLGRSAVMLMSLLACAAASAPGNARAAEGARSTDFAADSGVVAMANRNTPATEAASDQARTLDALFGSAYRDDDAAFRAAAAKAAQHPDLGPVEKYTGWRPRKRGEDQSASPASPTGSAIGAAFAAVAKYGLWMLAGIALLLLWRFRHVIAAWIVAIPRSKPARGSAVEARELVLPERLPDDLASAVRALWDGGEPRLALGLLYRAAVACLVERSAAPLPPGATESDCLRHARRLGDDPAAALFARVVARWREAAYADRVPPRGELDALLAAWSAWSAPR